MENFRRIFPVAVTILFCNFLILISCKDSLKNSSVRDESIAIVDTFQINKDLKKVSIDFITNNNISNGNIEVDIDKKESNQILITFICRGMADFGVRKFKPLFSYKINGNIFFVFTGAEELLNIPFDENKYSSRRQDMCDVVFKSCYVLEDNKIRKEDSCSFDEPFSNLKQSPLPTK